MNECTGVFRCIDKRSKHYILISAEAMLEMKVECGTA